MVYDRVRKDKWSQYAGVGAFGKRKPSRNGWASIYQLASRAGSARPQLLASRLAK